MTYLMGIDVGTYESKGVLTDLDGRVVAQAVRGHELAIPRQGWAEHDAEAVWWGDVCYISESLIDRSGVDPSEIKAVACSAIGPCLLPVDEACRPLRSGGILYGIDTRATAEIRELEVKLGEDAIFDRCANALSAQSVGPKILWLKKNEPEVYAKAYKFLTSTSFITARLTGEYVIDHLTGVYFAPCYDFSTKRWNEVYSRGIVEVDRLPRLAWSDEIVGTVTAEAARETGLAEGTLVTTGTADAAAEALSVGVTTPGQLMLMYGTTLFMIEVLDRPLKDRRLWATTYLFEGTSSLAAGMSTTGALTRWIKDTFARELVAKEEAGHESAYAALTQEASWVPAGAEGLLVLPYFSGERTPINDPEARGVFFGLTLAHTRGHLYRAVLESVGYGIRHHLDLLSEIGAEPNELVAVGGGTKSDLWLQIVSDICELPQKVPAVTIGASYGNAFLAGLAAGFFTDPNEIHSWLKDIRVIEPNMDTRQVYRKLFPLYKELYADTKGIMHELGEFVNT
ncbi:MAG: FGGY-family carbohydrate kinase [Trueperaceae bacterium]|nr:MAG: FGGY-family carbohydrate kinase [Trueperaceae bacterium]